jgi:hypothetical protein
LQAITLSEQPLEALVLLAGRGHLYLDLSPGTEDKRLDNQAMENSQ